MMRRLRVIGVVCLLASPVVAADEVLDLERAIDLALENNPFLKSVEERRNQVEAAVKEAWADVYPQLAFRGGFNRSRNPSLLNSADFEDLIEFFPDFRPQSQDLYNLSVELEQPLYHAGKIGAGIKLAKLVVEITDAQIAAARLEAGLITSEAYFRVLETREGLETIEIQRQARQESLAVVEARYELGDATELERLQARAALAELDPAVDRARGAVRVAMIDLKAILNVETDPDVMELTDPLPALPEADKALAFALETRPEFDDLELQLDAYDKQKRIVKADGFPQLNLNGYYGHTARLPENLGDSLYSDWLVGLGLRWEFFDGGRRKGKVAGLESQKQQVAWQLAALFNQVEQEVEAAITEYEASVSQWKAAEISAEAAREASRVARESYEEGVALQTDLLTAQEREISAEVVRVQSYYGARTSVARLARAVGLQADEVWQFTGHETGEQP
jgi:HAE1 family hydrophobic/amphiphilic exporter-1